MQILKNIIHFFKPDKTKKHVKLDLVFVIFYGIIVWRVASNLFSSAGFIPWMWTDLSFWMTNIIWNIMALFGLVWLFRIYIKSLKVINPTAEDILKTLGNIPYVKSSPQYKELCKKYQIKGE